MRLYPMIREQIIKELEKKGFCTEEKYIDIVYHAYMDGEYTMDIKKVIKVIAYRLKKEN
jgi:hypothetical protein